MDSWAKDTNIQWNLRCISDITYSKYAYFGMETSWGWKLFVSFTGIWFACFLCSFKSMSGQSIIVDNFLFSIQWIRVGSALLEVRMFFIGQTEDNDLILISSLSLSNSHFWWHWQSTKWREKDLDTAMQKHQLVTPSFYNGL